MKKQLSVYVMVFLLFNCFSLFSASAPTSLDTEIHDFEQTLPSQQEEDLTLEMDQLLQHLITVIAENEGAELNAEQVAAILIALIQVMVEALPECTSGSDAGEYKGAQKDASANQENINKEQFKDVVCTEAVLIASNIATLITARKNPLVLGQSIAGIFSGIARLIIQIINKKYHSIALHS